MKLIEFQITNYRSVNDSGLVRMDQRTALVGRNESGKSNILLALQSINPPEGRTPLSDIKDFPRDRPLTECSDSTKVAETKWALNEDERAHLAIIFPRAKTVSQVTVIRDYGVKLRVGFQDLPAISVDRALTTQCTQTIQSSVGSALRAAAADAKATANGAVTALAAQLAKYLSWPAQWSTNVGEAIKEFERVFTALGLDIPEAASRTLASLKSAANEINQDDKAASGARTWVVEKLPVFAYLSDYPELEGHQHVGQYLDRKQDRTPTEADTYFEKLCKVSGLNAQQLQELATGEHEKRQQLANRAGALITAKIRELWTDRQLKIRFHADGPHLDTLVSDPTAAYDVEINLNERSRGFKWFFSFYITFAADTAGGPAEDAILLLDEPGLYLHAIAQRDLLEHFRGDYANQILFTTHSPFMIPVDELSAVRTVSIDASAGSTVSNDPIGDEKTLFPLQTALGYSTTQSLFIGEKNVVLEGVSDYWYLSAATEWLAEKRPASALAADVVLTPAGGAQRVSYMVSLLASHQLKVVVLLDAEPGSEQTANSLVISKLIRDDGVVFVNRCLDPQPLEADIEDVLEPSVYEMLVAESYKKELTGKKLNPNEKVPRIAKRYEAAFGELGITFSKTRPAKLFLRLVASDPEKVMTKATADNFARLIENLNISIEKQLSRKSFQ